MDEKTFLKGIQNRSLVIGVIGLGYVGLPVACLLAKTGFKVIGLDVKKDRVDEINRGVSPIQGIEPGLQELLSSVIDQGTFHATLNAEELAAADIITINVETPVEADHKPRYVALRAACSTISKHLKKGALIIVESTIAPGTTRNVIIPEIENASSLVLNRDYFLGACPERVMPGKLLNNLLNMSRVCGGSTPETANVMKALYATFVTADINTTDIITAEVVKTAENTYRDVQIAFANEVALICEEYGADVYEVRELVNKSPNRQMHLPGAGVGGHCIPKDPWLLVAGMPENKPSRVIPAARAVNESMPHHLVSQLLSMLQKHGRKLDDSKIAVLGYAYLENSDDTRNSPSETLVKELEENHAKVVINDPYVPEYMNNVYELVAGCDATVLMVSHSDYQRLDWQKIRKLVKTPILLDGRHSIQREQALQAGFDFYCVGIGDDPNPIGK